MATLPVLKRFQQRFLKIGPGGGLEPAAGATVKFYHVGATATTSTSVPDSSGQPPIIVPVPVFSVGSIVDGETVQSGAGFLLILTVDHVDPVAKTVSVINTTGNPIIIPQYGRLIRRGSFVSVYQDPTALVSLGSSIQADAEGWAEAYIAEYRYDYTVTSGIFLAEAYADAEGSWVMR